MTAYYWDPQSVNGDHGQRVDYPNMRVGAAGELAFFTESDVFGVTPELVIAPGEWKAAWKADE